MGRNCFQKTPIRHAFARESNNALVEFADFSIPRQSDFADIPKPPTAPGGTQCLNGANGAAGVNGSPGASGAPTPWLPKIYILADDVQGQFGAIPNALKLQIDVRGVNGQSGQNGQNGQPGGDGGNGGDARYGTKPGDLLPSCQCAAGTGGYGGAGGLGGAGGDGADAGRGGDLALGGAQKVMDALSFAKITNNAGQPGGGGGAGMNAIGGLQGARGDRTHGNCGGGNDQSAQTPPSSANVVAGSSGHPATSGDNEFVPLNVTKESILVKHSQKQPPNWGSLTHYGGFIFWRIHALRGGAEEARDDSSSALRRAAYEATPLEFQTGMPSLRALSARLAEMPEPGKTMTPIGMASSI